MKVVLESSSVSKGVNVPLPRFTLLPAFAIVKLRFTGCSMLLETLDCTLLWRTEVFRLSMNLAELSTPFRRKLEGAPCCACVEWNLSRTVVGLEGSKRVLGSFSGLKMFGS